MAKYKKKPVVIEAKQFTTNNEVGSPEMDAIVKWANHGKDELISCHNGTVIYIETLEGQMTASVGDFIIKGVNGEFYPCKPEIFEKTYEFVED